MRQCVRHVALVAEAATVPMLDGGNYGQRVGGKVYQRADGNNENGTDLGSQQTRNADRLAEHEERDNHLQENAYGEEKARQGVENILLDDMPNGHNGESQENGENQFRTKEGFHFHRKFIVFVILGVLASLNNAFLMLRGYVEEQWVVAAASDRVQASFHQDDEAQSHADSLDGRYF